ncbi:MAG: 3-dehydroquinate synthase, partial [Chloroflexi bacterium]|nr:3-dehydroquinate synthase [Chloroflexota bacterium]
LTPAQVAEKVVTARNMRNNQSEADPEANKMTQDPDLASIVRTSQGDYPIWVGWGILDELGERVKRTLSPGAAYIISDERVSRHARRAQLALEAVGIPGHIFMMPPGEQHKTLETVQHVYNWLADRKAERGHMIVAVGGGVVGDLAGFVAATYLRGIPFAQVPTSLLAMMDAAIGGKVAVDLPQGKNLVGAFYQPKFVLSDVSTLQTLPQRELTSGWAEAIKHGLILDSDLLASFERDRDDILSLQREVTTDIIRRSVAVKAGIVSQDERETLGIRILLNYGHTLGHAIEVAGGYGNFLHGEAVSIGMMGAAYIGNALGMMSDGEVERQRALLDSYGLPLTCGEINVQAVNDAMLSDKKTSGRAIRWVLLNGIGNATTRNDVPDELVQDSIRLLTAN